MKKYGRGLGIFICIIPDLGVLLGILIRLFLLMREREGGVAINTRSSNALVGYINDCNQIDMGFVGGPVYLG